MTAPKGKSAARPSSIAMRMKRWSSAAGDRVKADEACGTTTLHASALLVVIAAAYRLAGSQAELAEELEAA